MEEIREEENIRNGIVNKLSYVATKKIDCRSRKYFITGIRLKNKNIIPDKCLIYIHQYHPPVIHHPHRFHRIMSNPAFIKVMIIGIIVIAIIVVIIGVTFA